MKYLYDLSNDISQLFCLEAHEKWRDYFLIIFDILWKEYRLIYEIMIEYRVSELE